MDAHIIVKDKRRGENMFNLEAVVDMLQSWGPWAALLGGGLIFIQTFIPFIPFLVLAGANVLVFGLWGGFWVTWVSAVLASILMFYLARTVGRDWAKRKPKSSGMPSSV